MSRVLVTGGTGFIGRHALGPLAQAGYEVHAPSVAEADLLDPGQVDALVDRIRPTHLVHFAWNVSPGYLTSVENVRWLEASTRLLRRFAENGGRRAVMAGTCLEYSLADGLCSEGVTPLAPASLYATSKDALRSVAEGLAAQVGLSVAWGRIFYVYGPDELPGRLVPAIARNVIAGRPAPASHASQVRDYMHSADYGRAFAALLDSDVEGAVNIGSGQPVVLRDLIDRVAALAGDRELVRYGDVPSPADEPARIVADVGRLHREVGWEPSMTLDEGLADCVEWWRTEGAGA